MNNSTITGGQPPRRRFATAFNFDDPNRLIGIEEFAEINGVAISSIRRWMNPENEYYDPRLPPPSKPGSAYQWYRYEAIEYRNVRMGRAPKE